MKDDAQAGRKGFRGLPEKQRKPGGPAAIPPDLNAVVIDLYRCGFGYRAIASLLAKEDGLNPDYSSVRRALIRLGIVPRRSPQE